MMIQTNKFISVHFLVTSISNAHTFGFRHIFLYFNEMCFTSQQPWHIVTKMWMHLNTHNSYDYTPIECKH